MAENHLEETGPPRSIPFPPAESESGEADSFPSPEGETAARPVRPVRPARRGKPKPWRHPQAWVPLELSFLLFLAPLVFWPLAIVLVILNSYSSEMANVPLGNLKDLDQPTVSYIYTEDGVLLAELYREHRLPVPLEKIPVVIISAFLAAEDSNFYQHQGVDLKGLVRAFLANLQAGQPVQGASTITQQMIRTFFLTNEKTYDRKLREIVLAWRVERAMRKDEILELYLNRIYLGRGAYGVASAAQLYFGKDLDEVTLAEAALLAGLAQAPGRLAAHLRTERSRERQRYVLQEMLNVGFINQAEHDAAVVANIDFIQSRPNYFREVSPQFTEVVRRQAIDLLGEEEFLTGGYKVYATLDLKAQAQAAQALRNGLDALARRQSMSPKVARLNQAQMLEFSRQQRERLKATPPLIGQEMAALVTGVEAAGAPSGPGLSMILGAEKGFLPKAELDWILGGQRLDRYFGPDDLVMVRLVGRDPESGLWRLAPAPPPDLQGALVLMENRTGRVLAVVGGRDFGQSQFNRAIQARRQPGSSFKPIVYTAAIDNGFTEASVVWDTPVSYPQPGQPPWQPKNYSGRYSGPVTLYDALKASINVVAVKVCATITPKVVIEYARRMGISSPLFNGLPLALGASEVTLLELVQAYSTFPNQGSWAWPLFINRVEDRHGRVLHQFEPWLTRAVSPQTAYIMLDMLVGVAHQGTAARVGAALKDIPLGGKTGTTSSQADTLFIGFTPEYTCGVWVGRDLRLNLGAGEQGGRSAAPIFIEFMQAFLADKETGRFEVPPGVVRRNVADDGEEDDVMAMSGRSFVFKVGEEGRGRSVVSVGLDGEYGEGWAQPAGPDYNRMPQEELDRRLLEYLQDYERRRGGGSSGGRRR
ncbi:MAG: PBP1A family penicillin-binding protein [Candidatus Adiutrix sp.]|nr:PBP1A family penicillin-binding protein [Candidatus Adiutrix sp.]